MEVIKALFIGLGIFIVIMLFLAYLPTIISKIADPPSINFIIEYFESKGCNNIEVKAWTNHYGVRFEKDNKKYYVKCLANPKEKSIKWVGKPPIEL